MRGSQEIVSGCSLVSWYESVIDSTFPRESFLCEQRWQRWVFGRAYLSLLVASTAMLTSQYQDRLCSTTSISMAWVQKSIQWEMQEYRLPTKRFPKPLSERPSIHWLMSTLGATNKFCARIARTVWSFRLLKAYIGQPDWYREWPIEY